MHDIGKADGIQQLQPRIGHAWRMHDDAIHGAARMQIVVNAFLVIIRDDGQDHVIAVAGVGFTGPGDEIGKDRVHDLMLGGDGNDMADGHGAAGGQPDGAGIGAVIVPLGRRHDPLARRFVDLGIAVERAADRRRGQAKLLGQLLEVHGGTGSKAVSIAAESSGTAVLRQSHSRRLQSQK